MVAGCAWTGLDYLTTGSPAPPTGCDGGTYAFCDDFDDRDADPRGAWDFAVSNGTSGSLAIDSTDSVSKPNSLLVLLPFELRDGGRERTLGKQVAWRSPITAELDLQIGIAISTRSDSFCDFVFIEDGRLPDGGDEPHTVYFGLAPAGYGVAIRSYPPGSAPVSDQLALDPLAPGWHHVRLDARFDKTNGGITTTIDGVARSSTPKDTYGPDGPQGRISVSVGAACDGSDPTVDGRVRVDNVKIY
jgi:hypothetical protein